MFISKSVHLLYLLIKAFSKLAILRCLSLKPSIRYDLAGHLHSLRRFHIIGNCCVFLSSGAWQWLVRTKNNTIFCLSTKSRNSTLLTFSSSSVKKMQRNRYHLLIHLASSLSWYIFQFGFGCQVSAARTNFTLKKLKVESKKDSIIAPFCTANWI